MGNNSKKIALSTIIEPLNKWYQHYFNDENVPWLVFFQTILAKKTFISPLSIDKRIEELNSFKIVNSKVEMISFFKKSPRVYHTIYL